MNFYNDFNESVRPYFLEIKRKGKKFCPLDVDLYDLYNYYLSIDEPEYAVLIVGEWGAGKTFHVKNTIDKEYYYVSLFGLKNAEEIHAAVFAAMYPIGSKIKSHVKAIAGAEIEYGKVKINLGSTVSAIATALIRQTAKKDKLIIFDDFERCAADYKIRLGAINHYVEHNKNHVFVVTNNSEYATAEFSEAKEKIFGYVHQIKPRREEAVAAFLQSWASHPKFKFLSEMKDELIDTHYHTGNESLRVLKHVIGDLFRFLDCLNDDLLSDIDNFRRMIKFVCIFSMEIRLGNLLIEDVGLIKGKGYSGIFKSGSASPNEENVSKVRNRLERHGISLFDSIPISINVLMDMLFHGKFDKDKILPDILSGSYFSKKEEMPPWMTFFKIEELEDEIIIKAKDELLKQFDQREIYEVGEILHMFSIRFLMIEMGFLSGDFLKVKKECLSYIDDVVGSGKLQKIQPDSLGMTAVSSSYKGYGYFCLDGYEREFDEIRKILIEKSVDAYVDEISKNEDRILDMMVNEPYEFSGRICHQNTGSGVWAEIPIFVSIDQEKFVDSFLRAPAKYWRILANALMNRYKLIGRSGEKINDEREWMRSVLKLLNEKKDHLDPLNKFRLDRFVNWNEFEKVLAREI
ncbi:hypothetical protein Cthiooxydans_15620 [Comamonas thiooxydans]|nr:hypothetical protein Cthiooxydans_15620 [Comamonas thiooxydans]